MKRVLEVHSRSVTERQLCCTHNIVEHSRYFYVYKRELYVSKAMGCTCARPPHVYSLSRSVVFQELVLSEHCLCSCVS